MALFSLGRAQAINVKHVEPALESGIGPHIQKNTRVHSALIQTDGGFAKLFIKNHSR